MKLPPLHSFEINSPLDRQAAMAAHRQDRKWFRWRWPNSANDDRFEGDVTVDSFNVCRIIGYRNSFLPVVEGAVHSSGPGSRIEVRMRLFVFVYVFVAVWAISLGGALFTDFWPFALGMLGFLYALTMGGFWCDASKQEQTLRKVFQAN
ncbi:MAG: hypothetical protein M0D54_07080 [Hyphomonadaceae bacterium JAD_PAG50586_4]|nr:MAG: hypothetical protein M0D54_07080 [Hyphomonadaceae bacterium JAD_PAG50586_4]